MVAALHNDKERKKEKKAGRLKPASRWA
jgi:hypothetical protein